MKTFDELKTEVLQNSPEVRAEYERLLTLTMNCYRLKCAVFGEFFDDRAPIDVRFIDQAAAVLATMKVPREVSVLKMRFGIDPPHQRLSKEEIAIQLEITPDRVRQIEAKALRKLRHPGRRRLWQDAI